MPSATVVGAGVFGAWTARALHQRGWAVTLVDQHGPANSRASSGGETRILRTGYGAEALYARWARASLTEWLALETAVGERLFVRTGALFLGSNTAWLRETLDTLHRERIPAEWLTEAQMRSACPALRVDAEGLFEPDAGVLFARRAVQALVRTLVADGVRLVTRRVDPEPLIDDESRDDAIVFAAGAWLSRIFPAALRDLVVPTRQEVFFFGPPPGDERFSEGHMPAWVAFDEGIYGLPDLEHRGVKVAIDAHGPEVDPETMDRTTDARALARMRAVLRRRMPELADAPLIESRVCQYENSPDGHFLLDRLPGHDRVWVAGGGSGHGFKHGPAVGRYLADLIEGQRPPEPQFAVAGRPERRRRVY